MFNRQILYYIFFLIISCIYLNSIAYSQSFQKTDTLLKQLRTAQSDIEKIKLLNLLGSSYINTIPDSALTYYMQAYNYAKQAGLKKEMANGIRNTGNVYLSKGIFDKALENYFYSLNISTELNDKKGIAKSYNAIAYVYADKGWYSKALEYLLKALKINEDIGDKTEMANSYLGIGNIHFYQNAYPKAIEYFQKALKIKEELQDKKSMASCYNNIGNVYKEQSDYKKAIEFFQKSLKIKKEFGDKKGMATCYNNIGMIYENQVAYEKAVEYYFKSLEIYKVLDTKKELCIVLHNIAAVSIKQKKYFTAIENAQKGAAIATEIGALLLERDNYEKLSVAYDSLHQSDKALAYHKIFKKLNDSIFNQERSKQIADMQTKYETEKKEQEIFVKDKELLIQNLTIDKMNYYILILAVLVLLSTLSLVIVYFTNRKNRIQTILNTLKLEQKLLVAQMNPHFIFNLLSVIQNIIYQNQKEYAVKFLSRFARLIRMILENSRMEYINLDKEIELLKIYMELQSVQCKNKFNYEIEIDPNLTTDMISIPPMLAQPFIENAIEHGIMHKESMGNIKIRFTAENEMLLFEVTDDGVGREKSKEIEELHGKNENKSISLATVITQERIENINKSLRKKKHQKITFNIVDLKDENGKALGTKVTFNIPFRTI